MGIFLKTALCKYVFFLSVSESGQFFLKKMLFSCKQGITEQPFPKLLYTNYFFSAN